MSVHMAGCRKKHARNRILAELERIVKHSITGDLSLD